MLPFLCLQYEIYFHDHCEGNYITCIMYDITGCGTDRKQSSAIKTDHSSEFENKNEGGRWGGGFVDEPIGSNN